MICLNIFKFLFILYLAKRKLYQKASDELTANISCQIFFIQIRPLA